MWFHQLGTPVSADRYVIGRDFPRIAEIELDGGRDGKYLLAKVHNGDGGEVAFHVRDLAGQWTQVAGFTDGVKQMAVGEDGRLYAMSIKDAPLGRIIAIPLDRPLLANASVVVPEANIVAENVTPTKSRLYVKYRDGGPSAARMFAVDGKRLGDIPAEPISDISDRHCADRRRRHGAHDELPVAADVVSLRRRRSDKLVADAAHQPSLRSTSPMPR